MKILNEGKQGEIRILAEGLDQGLANLIVEKLLEDKDVEFAASDYDHPTQRNPVIELRSPSPKKHLLAAISAVEKDLKEFSESISKKKK
ncbi:MAG: RpoL/Rpb11 RNA polymerase subunit family protein [Candidatus Micrarchaeota archaeon]